MGDRRQHRKDRVQDRMQQKIHKAKKASSGASRRIRNICVYCGSNIGTNPAYAAAARQLGQSMAKERIGLVYGGGGLGLMGELARAVLADGGRVTGIIPAFLSVKERMLRDVTELVVVDDMHQRKKLMFDKSDAFVALPGGIGTLEELVEQLTWAQLGRHKKPILILNIKGFWDPLRALLDHMRRLDFIRLELGVTLLASEEPEGILPKLRAAAAAVTEGEKQGKPETVERM